MVGPEGRVLWSVPEVGYLVARVQHPYALAGTAVLVAALVTWGLWPREGEDEE